MDALVEFAEGVKGRGAGRGLHHLKLRSHARRTLCHVAVSGDAPTAPVGATGPCEVPDASRQVSSSSGVPSQTGSAARTGSSRPRVIYPEGVHLMVPSATHHERLCCGDATACSGASGQGPSGDPSGCVCLDVVFIHGLLGGPYKTWRIRENRAEATSSSDLASPKAARRSRTWVHSWLANDLPPCVRYLTVKYQTALSEWRSSSLRLQDVSENVNEMLKAAGVGTRPTVFVTHSMGGLVIKDILARGAEDPRFADISKNTKGLVFFSCPHFGSRLADISLGVPYVVLRPAPSILDLKRGGPLLNEINRHLWGRHRKGEIDVLGFGESLSTPLMEAYGRRVVRAEVVPWESAYPGFGKFLVVENADHISVCKPVSKEDMSYTKTREFIENMLGKIRCKHCASRDPGTRRIQEAEAQAEADTDADA
eukprot:jgi/Mesvir1/275/Mv13610-RA.2